MKSIIQLGDLSIEVTLKDIKNVHLSVYPPSGVVRVSAPKQMSLETIRVFAISRLDWIKKQQKQLRDQDRETPREFLNRESHYVWGKRYLLKVEEKEAAPRVALGPRHLVLQIRPGTHLDKRREVLASWHREQVREAIPKLLEKWESETGAKVEKVFVRQMKTKWGSCNPARRTIRLNSELVKKPPECLEYVLVHELIHFHEPSHNQRFRRLLKQHIPNWEAHRDELNRLPVRHEDWDY